MSLKVLKDSAECKPIIHLREAAEIQAEQEESEKWGEVFLTPNQILKLACIKCNRIFLELALFGNHIHDGSCKFQPKSSENRIFKRSLSSNEISDRLEVAFEEVENSEGEDLVRSKALYDGETKVKNETPLVDDFSEELSRAIDISDIEVKTTSLETSINNPVESTDSDNSDSEWNINRKSCPKSKHSEKSTRPKKKRRPLKSELTVEQMPFCAACCRSYAAGFRGHLHKKHSDLITHAEIKNLPTEALEDKIVQSLNEMACEYCNKVFTELAKFKTHSAVHNGLSLYDCKLCDKQFSKKYKRRMHMDSHEGYRYSDIEVKTCLETSINNPAESTDSDNTRSSSDAEWNVNRKSCPKSKHSGESTRPKKRRRPLKSELTAEQMPFCAACCRSFATGFRGHLHKKHSDLITNEEINNLPTETLEDKIVQSLNEMACEYCNKVFTELAKFKTHSAVHNGLSLYDCKLCDKQFSKRYARKTHMDSHEGNRPYKCPHCPSDFVEKRNRDNHVKCHLKIFEYKCSCGKNFLTNYGKELHERRHAKERPFQCEECGSKFLTLSLLRKHMLRHKNIRPAKCSLCDKAFYNNELLKGHMLTHTKEKKFSCEICNERFPRQRALKQHSLLHEKVKKYTCDVCGKKYAQFAGLYSHKKSHGEKF